MLALPEISVSTLVHDLNILLQCIETPLQIYNILALDVRHRGTGQITHCIKPVLFQVELFYREEMQFNNKFIFV